MNRPYKDNRYGYIIDFADIKENFEQTNEDYLKELNRFSNPDEIGPDAPTDTLTKVIENPDDLIKQIKDARQELFEYTIDNAEVFSQEISEIEDRDELLKLKKLLVSVKDCFNIVRTFGDENLKKEFESMEIGMLPAMISDLQRHIESVAQKELFERDDATKQLINEAMSEISFSFNKIGEEEMKMISGGAELQEKWEYTIRSFTDNMDQEDPEYLTIKEAFIKRFKEKGFVVDSIAQYNAQNKALDEIVRKLNELQRKNKALAKKYNDDAKFVRVHKRIREENEIRKKENKTVIISTYEDDIKGMLFSIKLDIDNKVYDRNDILKKDAYFEQTVMSEITNGMKKLGYVGSRKDRTFIQQRISREYLAQYNATYPAA